MSDRAPANVILRSTLNWSAIIVGVLAVVGALTGLLIAGTAGLWSALVGVVLAGLFLGLTALLVLIAGRMPPGSTAFFGIVLGGWFVKLVVFVVIMLVLRAQPWISPFVFFFSVVAGVIASLVVDMVVMARSRVPYVGDVPLPTSSEGLGAAGEEGEQGPRRS